LCAAFGRAAARRLFGDARSIFAVTRAAVDVFRALVADASADDVGATALLRATERAAVLGLVALRAERLAERKAASMIALGLAQSAAAGASRRALGRGRAARRQSAARVACVLAELLSEIDVLGAACCCECERDGDEHACVHGSSTPTRSAKSICPGGTSSTWTLLAA
jgi:hypothetical protein